MSCSKYKPQRSSSARYFATCTDAQFSFAIEGWNLTIDQMVDAWQLFLRRFDIMATVTMDTSMPDLPQVLAS
jgi:hypothetical protein